jgi:hypothetical protein
MTEAEYLKATNLVKVRAAITLVNDMLGGDGWGVSKEAVQQATSILISIREGLEESFELEEG